jgi:anti-sigma factor ChrR (cupin superfamily)
MNEILLNTNELEWEESDTYPHGTMVKVLRDEGEVRSLLLKLSPGFHMDPHAHTTSEQHFILEGGYETGSWKFGPGAYHYLPARMNHGPYTSKNGAVVLVIWEKQGPGGASE